ncbi:homocysteine S-methyltransferase family protein, partial [Streptomyces sp. ALB3]|uniref:homocysteine S-methyltransferase family protein n=1 Tax=Streptomyces sp. ALB3 TaxID=3374278 RepID=UPI0037BD1710
MPTAVSGSGPHRADASTVHPDDGAGGCPGGDVMKRSVALREALAARVVVADGAMGTMLQAQDPTLEDFENLEGCNEILNVTRPDIVRSVH